MVRTARALSAALILIALALVLAACGSGDDGATTSTAGTTSTAATSAGAAPRYTAQEVAKTAGFTKNGDGTWTNPTGCTVTKILLTHDEVLANRPSPDALVVTNGTDDVGVAFASKTGCREALLANLSRVK